MHGETLKFVTHKHSKYLSFLQSSKNKYK